MEETQDEILPLIELGLSRYEANTYYSLVCEGRCTAKEISCMTGIPYGKIYEVLENLMSRGYVFMIPSKPMQYEAIAPVSLLESAKEQLEQRMSKVEQYTSEHLEPLYQSGSSTPSLKTSFLLVQGRATIFKKIDEAIEKSENSIHILTTENGLKRLVAHKENFWEAKMRGVSINIIAPLTRSNCEDASLLGFCNIHDEAQVHNTMLSIDGKLSMVIEINPDNENYKSGRDVAIMSQSASFTCFLDALYLRFMSVVTEQQGDMKSVLRQHSLQIVGKKHS